MNGGNFLRSLFLLFIFGCLFRNAFSQDVPYRPSKIIPPSPTAASIGSFGNIQVGFYNGLPDIGIPLYDIITANHSLKIGLRYNASGTKVLQDASLVGLGWTLNAGGAITRTVRQLDDFAVSGYYRSTALPASNPDNSYKYNPATENADKMYMDRVYSGKMDGEPDIFNYNFGRHSGSFVLGKAVDGSVVFYDEKNNMNLAYTSGSWIAIDEDGYKYYLGTGERSQDYYRSSNTELTNYNGVDAFYFNIESSPITSWYLDSIVAPTSEKISFEYTLGKSLSLVNKSEQFYKLGAITILNGCVANMPAGLINDYRSYDASRQALRDVYLEKINFANGSVEFKKSDRNDISYLDNNDGLAKPSKLDSVIIKDANGIKLKAYSFYYTYFLTSGPETSLKLDSIVESGRGGSVKPPYAFSYIYPNNLPSKYTKAIDHWGYYNGINNATLLPSTAFPVATQSFVGADRSPDTIYNYAMYGVLSAIRYPTGGSTSLEYELHDYFNLHGEQAYKTLYKSAIVRSNPDINPGGDIITATFHIPPRLSDMPLLPGEEMYRIPVTIQCSYQKVDPNVSDLVSLGYSNLWKIKNDGGLQSVAGCTTANYGQPNPSPVFNNMNLDTGNYKIYIQSTRGWSTYMSVSWEEKEKIPLLYRKGGGIRIKTLTDLDGGGNKTVRKFLYKGNDNNSSGMLLASPRYAYSYVIGGMNYTIGSGIVIPCDYIVQYYGILSGSLFPPGFSSKSGTIGYSKVTELSGENGENGRTEYYYHNEEESVDLFPSIPVTGNPLNGKPDSIIVFDAQGNQIKRNDYTYQLKESSSLKGVKLWTAPTLSDAQYVYSMKFYDNYSSWVVPVTEKETIFNGTKKVSVTKRYYYDNYIHRSPTRIDIDKSDGRSWVTKYKRPDDYSVSGNTSFVEQMRSLHIISPVIEQEVFLQKDAAMQLVSGTFTSYKKYNGAFFRPDIVYNTELTVPSGDITESSFAASGQPVFHSSYKPQVYFEAYDRQGNLQSSHKINDVSETYLWGYNSQYPVARIVGADYNTVKPFLNQSILDSPLNDQQLRDYLAGLRPKLPAAIITYYTYNPQIGMTSETDATGKTVYYEYDDMGKLRLIKDKDGKILRYFDYQYQKPITQ